MLNSSLTFLKYPVIVQILCYWLAIFPFINIVENAPGYANSNLIEDLDSIGLVAQETPEALTQNTVEDSQEEPSDSSPSSPDTTPIQVKTIDVINSTIFTPADFEPITQPLAGKTVTLEELRQVADKITELYLNQGYITSRAIIDKDSLVTGTIKIIIIEGEVEAIEIQGTQRLANYVRSRIELGTGKPSTQVNLKINCACYDSIPLIENIEASLRAGTGIGQSIFGRARHRADPFEGSISIDNYSPPSVGAERLSLNLLYRNLTGIGDSISASYRPRIQSFDGTYRLEFNYSAPLNPMNGTLNLRALIERNEVVEGTFEDLDIRGEAERYVITYRQPIIRTPREELALSLGFDYFDGQTFTFVGPTPFGLGPDEEGISRTSVFTFAQDYTLRNPSGAWAFPIAVSLWCGIFDATENNDPIPDGEFFSWLGQIQRVQLLGEDNLLIIQFDLQLTPDPLLPSEQFVIGGGQSVRGYRQNVLASDNGIRFSIEDRIILARNEAEQPVFTLAPFFDLGAIWNVADNPNIIVEDQRFIAGLGLGLIWQPVEGLNLRIDYAPPLIDLDTRGDNVQDDGFYFSASYSF